MAGSEAGGCVNVVSVVNVFGRSELSISIYATNG